MATTVEITQEEIRVKLNAPLNVVPMVLHKLFQVPYDLPFPTTLIFEEQPISSIYAVRKLVRNATTITIGLALTGTFDKETILNYIQKAAKSVIDLSVWEDLPPPPEPEPEPIVPPEEETGV